MLATGRWEAVFFAALCSSVCSQFAQPSGMKLFKMHVQGEDAAACMSLLQTLVSVFMIVGPILGTLVYRQLGIGLAMMFTGLSFLVSALAMLYVPPDRDGAEARVARRSSVYRDMADGIRFVISSKELLRLNLCFMLVGLGVGAIAPLGVFVVTERLGLPAQDVQRLAIPYGLGELVGGIAAFGLASKISPRLLLTAGLLVDGLGILLVGWSLNLWVTMGAQFLIALLQPAIFIGNNALVMQHTDQDYIGRVTGIRTPLMTGSMLLTMSMAGALKAAISLTGVYAVAGACFVAGLLAIIQIRQTGARP
ncbi:MFS transporter [Gordoniibacillus kamchatkensis]|uniref:MFS transporter n=1 Tax=Gordoniibacillus kamchatkensis TaxID=1590651 RepID=UPI001E4BD982|nr:MFS transporter [Paenibacillus sp. VKM B-2647]